MLGSLGGLVARRESGRESGGIALDVHPPICGLHWHLLCRDGNWRCCVFGSFLGDEGPLPIGEGGLNPSGAFFYMWHSHNEVELINFDIFPGGMLTMMAVEHPSAPIPRAGY